MRSASFAAWALSACLSACVNLDSNSARSAGAWVHDSGEGTGPTVLVFAGGRRDQAMPRLAARQVAGWRPIKGRLVVASISAEEVPSGFESFVEELDPDWVLELREDFYYARPGMETLGGSVLHGGGDGDAQLAERVCAAVNGELEEESRFRALRRSEELSISEGAVMSLVTSARKNPTPTMDYPKSARIRRQRQLTHAFLCELGMLPSDMSPDIGLVGAEPEALHFAVYDGEGAGRPLPFITDLQNGVPGAIGYPLSPSEIAAGALDGFDAVLFPGGMASHQFDALGAAGRAEVTKFVSAGGGYIGICAGAYMAASDPYQWGLNLLDARIVDHEHWARGIGPVELELSDSGRAVLGDFVGRRVLHYGQGPIVEPAERADLSDYEVLGWYRSGIGENGADPNVMVDTPAILCAPFGEGRVLVSSGHVEWSAGLESFLPRYLVWVCGRTTEGL